jgi:hypothetical protein
MIHGFPLALPHTQKYNMFMEQQESGSIKWQASEYPFHKKSVDWYWWFGLSTIGLISLAVYLNNILFAFVIGIGAFSLLLYAIRPPRTLDYEATSRGIRVEKKLYPYQTITCFWLKDDRDEKAEKVILLESQKRTMPIIALPLGNVNIDELRYFLLDFIEEQEIHEPFGQRIMEWLGF